ncbi:MAG: hypothetical protein GJV46_03820 [Geobacter sp.]|nr:hypothetical protein [Geobacter sp.]
MLREKKDLSGNRVIKSRLQANTLLIRLNFDENLTASREMVCGILTAVFSLIKVGKFGGRGRSRPHGNSVLIMTITNLELLIRTMLLPNLAPRIMLMQGALN